MARHLACRNPLHDHFHQRQNKRLLAPLVALENVSRKAAVPRLRYLQGHRPNPCIKRARPVTIPVALPLFRPLVPIRSQRFRHLRLQYLMSTVSTSFDNPS